MSVIDKILKYKKSSSDFCTAIIVAAGKSQRMGRDKILMPIGGMPVIAHTLKAFEKSEHIDEIIVVTKYESIQQIADICNEYGISKISKVVIGGKTRAESALIGVCEASDKAGVIAIHDGARPFVSVNLIDRVINALGDNSAVAPATFSTDTVRIINSKGIVTQTPDRDTVALIQTPQAFSAEVIKTALTKAVEKNIAITDDCSAVEAMGLKVCVVAGEQSNIKLTSSMDIYIAEKILSERGAVK